MIDVYFCYRSEFLKIADKIGYGCGVRSDKLNEVEEFLNKGYEINFVDNNFKNPDVDRLLSVTERVEPDFTVLPDLYDSDDFDDLLDIGAEVEGLGTTPVFVPKDVIDWRDVPDEWRIGYSVPSGYGETDIPIEEFVRMDVHLLGGSPQRQIEIADRAVENHVNIVSVDGNALSKGAKYGKIVNDPSRFLGEGRSWRGGRDYETTGEIYEWKSRMIVSLVNYYEIWRRWSTERNVSWVDGRVAKGSV